MQIGAQIGGSQAILAALLAKKTEASAFDLLPESKPTRGAGQNAPVESAGVGKSAPTSLYSGLDAGSIMALQTEPPSAEDVFLKEAKKNPLERIVEKLRKEALDAMGQSEESLQSMPADQQTSIEKKISEFIEKKLREAMGGDSQSNERQTQTALKQGSAFQGAGSLIEAFA